MTISRIKLIAAWTIIALALGGFLAIGRTVALIIAAGVGIAVILGWAIFTVLASLE
jgi:hypothetical protein